MCTFGIFFCVILGYFSLTTCFVHVSANVLRRHCPPHVTGRPAFSLQMPHVSSERCRISLNRFLAECRKSMETKPGYFCFAAVFCVVCCFWVVCLVLRWLLMKNISGETYLFIVCIFIVCLICLLSRIFQR